MNVFKAKAFIYRFARPIDIMRYRILFESGRKEDVTKTLETYQNLDGGFGHGLESDYWNPFSSPIQTWTALEILREFDFFETKHPMIEKVLDYLRSLKDFSMTHLQWQNTIPTNNDYPHAIWWHYDEKTSPYEYNPTAYLAGFVIRFETPGTPFYQLAETIVKQAYQYFLSHPTLGYHSLICYVRLQEFLRDAGRLDLVPLDVFEQQLKKRVNESICHDTSKWDREYVVLPSHYIQHPTSIYLLGNETILNTELESLGWRQREDGGFSIPWEWGTNYPEFDIVKRHWEAIKTIQNLSFYRAFTKQEGDHSNSSR